MHCVFDPYDVGPLEGIHGFISQLRSFQMALSGAISFKVTLAGTWYLAVDRPVFREHDERLLERHQALARKHFAVDGPVKKHWSVLTRAVTKVSQPRPAVPTAVTSKLGLRLEVASRDLARLITKRERGTVFFVRHVEQVR